MITSLYAGLLGLVLIVLSIRVIGARRRGGIGLGDGGDRSLQRRIRAQGNFAEYVPIVLLLMLPAEWQGVASWVLHLVGGCLLVGRIVHALSISREPEIPVGRVIGMALTFTSLGISSVACLAVAFGGLN